jgi:predicted transcriptional regulator
MLPHAVYDSPEFESLKPINVAVLLLMMRKYNGYNNGAIQLGVREVARRCHCSLATASRALNRLQHAGLISLTYNGHLVRDFGRPNAPSRWKLNFVQLNRKAR